MNAGPLPPSAVAITSLILAASPGPSVSRPTVIHTIPPRKSRRTLRSWHAFAASVVLPKPPAPTSPVVSATAPEPAAVSADTTSASSPRSTQPGGAGTGGSRGPGLWAAGTTTHARYRAGKVPTIAVATAATPR